MEIQRWHCYLAINCVLIIPLISAKPFSINEALAAESKSQRTLTAPSSISETTTRFSLNKGLTSEPVHKLRKFKSSKHYPSPLTLGKLPSLKTKRLSEITSQLKSRSLSDILRPLHKRKRQSKKREVYKNDKIDEKYFPLFRNLGLLFDNLLNESGDSNEISKKKYKRRMDGNEEGRRVVCSCAVKSDIDTEPEGSKPYKKTIVSAKALSIPFKPSIPSKKPSATPTATDTPVGNFGSLRQDKDVPSVLPRDTFSSRRDDNGYSERSRPTLHRSTERDITRNLRNRKHLTRDREYEFSTENDEENTDSTARDDASCDEHRSGRSRGNLEFSYERERNTADEDTSFTKVKKADNTFRGHVYKLPGETNLKTRRNETESKEFIPKHFRGIRGPLSEDKIGNIAEPIQSEEDNEKSFNSITHDNTSDKRLIDGNGASSRENQKIRPRDETVISINDFSNLNLALENSPRVKAPSVSIIDGYSVARDKNGQNKLNEKFIRIHGNDSE